MYTGTTTHGVRSWRIPNLEQRFVNTKAGSNILRPEREAAHPSP